MGTEEDRSRVRELLKSEKLGWKRDRLIALKMGFSPENSLEAIAETIGSSVSTVLRWFGQYRDQGLEASLKRNYGGGRPPKLNDEIVELLESGLRSGPGIPPCRPRGSSSRSSSEASRTALCCIG